MQIARQTQNGVDITAAVQASLVEIKRHQADIDGRELSKADRLKSLDSLESLKTSLGLKGITEAGFVGLVNAMREQGIQLQEICRHDQLTMRFYQTIQSELPFDLDATRERMALARRFPKPVQCFEEAREVYRDILQQVNLLKFEEGRGGGTALAIDKMTLFLKQMKCFKQDLQKNLRTSPLETFSRMRLTDFIDATSWVVIEHERAKRLKAQKDKEEAE